MKKTSLKLLIIFLFSFSFSFAFANHQIVAIKGVLDLRHWDWDKNGAVELNGEWEFYWKKFCAPDFFRDSVFYKINYIPVPSFWNNYIPQQKAFQPAFGYATYHLLILCPPDARQLALKFLTVESAYKLFVNGKKILLGAPPWTAFPRERLRS